MANGKLRSGKRQSGRAQNKERLKISLRSSAIFAAMAPKGAPKKLGAGKVREDASLELLEENRISWSADWEAGTGVNHDAKTERQQK